MSMTSVYPGMSGDDEPPASDGGALLDDIRDTITRFCVLPGVHELVAVALWVVLTHLLNRFDYAPRLVIRSAEKRSGKSRLLEIIGGLAYKPIRTANCTAAYVYRSLDAGKDTPPPTLLYDEADAIFGTKKAAESNDDLRALINAGFERNAPAGRTVGPTHIPTDFNTFAMVALAGIGRMPDTIEDRAVVVMMKRRTADEPVHPYRLRRDQPDVHKLRDRLAEWVDTVRDRAGADYPELPIEDRAADLWEPLVSVAELAGGDWPELARAAAKALTDTSADDDTRSFNVLLLNDIEALFDDVTDGFIKSADLCKRLRGLDESPWSDFELTPSKLGRRLSDAFRIRTRRVDSKGRGYHRVDFADAFNRHPSRQKVANPGETGSDQAEHNSSLSRPTSADSRQDDDRADDTGAASRLAADYEPTKSQPNNRRSDGIKPGSADYSHLSGGFDAYPPCFHCDKPVVSKHRDEHGRYSHFECDLQATKEGAHP